MNAEQRAKARAEAKSLNQWITDVLNQNVHAHI